MKKEIVDEATQWKGSRYHSITTPRKISKLKMGFSQFFFFFSKSSLW
jgi:hypothetical protein